MIYLIQKILIVVSLALTACATVPSSVPTGAFERQPNSELSISPVVAARAKELSKYKDVATGQGYRSREALGAARLERHIQGRKLLPGKSTSVDWVDQKIGDISFKGPLVDDTNYDGVLEPLDSFDLEAVKNAVRRDLQDNPMAPTLVVDTLGLSDGETRFLEGEILKLQNPYKKAILLLQYKELKSLNSNRPGSSFDRYPSQP